MSELLAIDSLNNLLEFVVATAVILIVRFALRLLRDLLFRFSVPARPVRSLDEEGSRSFRTQTADAFRFASIQQNDRIEGVLVS